MSSILIQEHNDLSLSIDLSEVVDSGACLPINYLIQSRQLNLEVQYSIIKFSFQMLKLRSCQCIFSYKQHVIETTYQ